MTATYGELRTADSGCDSFAREWDSLDRWGAALGTVFDVVTLNPGCSREGGEDGDE